MKTVYIGLGSNIGRRLSNCKKAVRLISRHSDIVVTKTASWIETEPYGVKDQDKFINGAIEIKTKLSPQQLLVFLKKTEKKMGRKKEKRWGPRLIDLDILLYEGVRMKTKSLTLPHPDIKNRDFVKKPLLEIRPRRFDSTSETCR